MKTLFNKVTLEWLKAACIRALRTMAQTALGMLTIGAAINEINWVNVLSVAFVAGVYSVLTSLATTLPEVATDGVLEVGKADEKTIYKLNLNVEPELLAGKTQIVLKVEAVPFPTQE